MPKKTIEKFQLLTPYATGRILNCLDVKLSDDPSMTLREAVDTLTEELQQLLEDDDLADLRLEQLAALTTDFLDDIRACAAKKKGGGTGNAKPATVHRVTRADVTETDGDTGKGRYLDEVPGIDEDDE